MRRYVVVGGGIVGLATAHRLLLDRPDAEVTVLEKETRLAAHQSGRNSGVIHAGVYYRPGSLKARLCQAGSRSMVEFCAANGITARVCGKLVVATGADELPGLRALRDRAVANGLSVRLVTPEEAREVEPAVRCAGALHVSGTAVVDFGEVCAALGRLIERAGARIRSGARLTGVRVRAGEQVVRTTAGEFVADVLVNCAGLHSDRVARLCGVRPAARIIPFRGEYYELRPARRDLVRALVYPVPDARFPFLGVHLTRAVDGSVHAGPNAVLALAREGYSWAAGSLRDVADLAGYPGFWRLGSRHLGYGLREVRRSLSRRRFAADLARLMPEITEEDLVAAQPGVRAQAVAPDGALVDDFLIVEGDRQVHVLNAPSPAATSALEIARHVVARLPA